jgi:hypothetical protein
MRRTYLTSVLAGTNFYVDVKSVNDVNVMTLLERVQEQGKKAAGEPAAAGKEKE